MLVDLRNFTNASLEKIYGATSGVSIEDKELAAMLFSLRADDFVEPTAGYIAEDGWMVDLPEDLGALPVLP